MLVYRWLGLPEKFWIMSPNVSFVFLFNRISQIFQTYIFTAPNNVGTQVKERRLKKMTQTNKKPFSLFKNAWFLCVKYF